ncbi:MAG: fibronectin type III domain-containing protein, partial [SAR202 cluster bacterium]|nr:fibronectin type III domain-containing protein [SAR202 cluster bacterium]
TATSTATSTTLKGLTNATAYTFSVEAANADGTGPSSTSSAAITPDAFTNPEGGYTKIHRVAFLLLDAHPGLDFSTLIGGSSFVSEFGGRYSSSTLASLIFEHDRSINTFIKEASFSREAIQGNVYGWHEITSTTTIDQLKAMTDPQIYDYAVDVFDDTYDLSTYDVIAVNALVDYGTRSMAQQGGTGSPAFVRLINSLAQPWPTFDTQWYPIRPNDAWAHELIHALGISGHAVGYYDNPTTAGTAKTINSYANPFSVMGSRWWASHPDAGMKRDLGWLTSNEVRSVASNGTYRIGLLETSPDSYTNATVETKHGLFIDLPFDIELNGANLASTILSSEAIIEYRGPYGFDWRISTSTPGSIGNLQSFHTDFWGIATGINPQGVLIYADYPDHAGTQATILLDGNPGTAYGFDKPGKATARSSGDIGELSDAFLNQGQTYTFTNGMDAVTVEVIGFATDDSWVDVRITGIPEGILFGELLGDNNNCCGVYTTDSGRKSFIPVLLNSQPASDVVVSVSSDDTGEITVSPSKITFTPSNWNTPQTVTVTGVEDGIADTDVNVGIWFAVVSESSDDSFGDAPDRVAVIKNRCLLTCASNPIPPAVTVTVPDAPTGVTATAGNGQAEVSWTAPSKSGGVLLPLYYTVASSPDGLSVRTYDTSAIVIGLTNDTPYTFTVTATNSVGSSATSTASNAVTGAVPMPSVGGWSLIILAIGLASIIGLRFHALSRRGIRKA